MWVLLPKRITFYRCKCRNGNNTTSKSNPWLHCSRTQWQCHWSIFIQTLIIIYNYCFTTLQLGLLIVWLYWLFICHSSWMIVWISVYFLLILKTPLGMVVNALFWHFIFTLYFDALFWRLILTLYFDTLFWCFTLLLYFDALF